MNAKLSKKRTIAIVGGNWFNKGAETMLRTVISRIGLKDKDVHFVIFIPDKKMLANIPIFPSNVEVYVESLAKKDLCRDIFLGLLYRLFKYRILIDQGVNLYSYSDCDAIIDIHGYAFTKIKKRVPIMIMQKMLVAKLVSTDYYLFPQSIDYVKSAPVKLLARIIFPFLRRVYVRGEESRVNLIKMVGDKLEIKVIPDIALVFNKLKKEERFARWKQGQNCKKILLVSVNKRLNNVSSLEDYKREITKFISKYISNSDGAVVLLPHEGVGSENNRDMKICNDIFTMLSLEEKSHVFRLDSLEIHPAEYKYIISESDFVIASRFHVCVASLSLAKPTMVIGWSFKYKELMSWFNQEDYVLSAENTNLNDIELMYKKMEINEVSIKTSLEALMIKNKALVDELFDDINYDLFNTV